MDEPKGATPGTVDARLLRFRSRPGAEPAAPLAEELLRADRARDALEVVQSGLQKSPEDGRLLLVEGQAWLAEGQLERAQAALIAAARVAPRSKDAFRTLGEVLLKRGDPARAAKVLERAALIDPNDRAVKMLVDRAQRLAKIAETDGDEAASRAAQKAMKAGDPEEFDEKTVVRSDLSAKLAESSRENEIGSPYGDDDDESPTSVGTREEAFGPGVPAAVPPIGELGVGSGSRVPTSPGRPAPVLQARPAPVATPSSAPSGKPSPWDEPPRPSPPASTLTGTGSPMPPSAVVTASEPKGAPPMPARKATLVMGSATVPGGGPPKPTTPGVAPASPLAARPTPAPLGPKPGVTTSPEARRPAPIAAPAAAPTAARSAPIVARPAPIGTRPLPTGSTGPTGTRPPPPAFGAAPDPFGGSDPFAAPAIAPAAPAPPAFAPPPAFVAPITAAAPAPFTPPPTSALEPELPDSGMGGWDDAALSPVEAFEDDGVPPEPEPDVEAGALAGTEEDVDEVLRMLEREGIFEPPTGTAAAWATRKEAKRDGVRVGPLIAIVWSLAILAAVGGWFGWQKWVAARHAQAAQLVAQARREALDGDHSALVDAERHLVEARDLAPRDVRIPALLLFVQSQRALEEGSFDAGYLRPTVERAKRDHAPRQYIELAQAVLDASDNEPTKARADLASALAHAPNDGLLLYLAGRLEQRLGDDVAQHHLEQATQREASLAAASIALAEWKNDDGNREDALALLDGVLGRYHEHLRAKLWRMLLGSDEVDPDQGLRDIDGMAVRLRRGAPTDRLLAELVRARLYRRKGDSEHAGAAVDHAMQAGATEPRLLALAAAEARGAGKLDRAQQAALQAVQGAPTNSDFRKMLAEIQIAKRDGVRALATLGELSTDDPDVLMLSAKAALLVGSDSALAAASAAIDQFVVAHPDSTEAKALAIRLKVALGDITQLDAAKALAADAPGDPLVSVALGEAALVVHDTATALTALNALVRASPDDPDGHYLLGRARRADGDATGAEESFRRALTLLPAHTEASLALGRLLLDEGKYADADRVYQDLARRGGISGGSTPALYGRIGRVESLVGLGRLADAEVQLEGMRSTNRDTPSARVAAAHLHLAQGKPGDALTDLRPIIDADGEKTAEVLALYGDALFDAGQVDPAAAQYDAALAKDSEFPEALLGRANVAVRAEQGDDATTYCNRLDASLHHRIRPPSLRARMLLALGRAKLLGHGDADAAKQALTAATALDGCPPEAFFYLGEALSSSDAPSARTAYQRYLELAPTGELAGRARRAADSH